MSQRRFHRYGWLFVCLFCFTLFMLGRNLFVAHAEPAAGPAVSYNSQFNLIYIGSDVGVPASEPITVPDLANALTGMGLGNLLTSPASGVWLLKANLVISTTAELQATKATINELRLDSPPINVATQLSPNITAKLGGHLLISGIKVSAWENGALDTNIANGRSYLLALNGGRMDIVAQSEIFNLGYTNGEPSGISWRERSNEADPTTGSTGSLQDSNIHDNYFGMYSYAAYNVKILHNKVHDNIGYGIDPHTGTQNMEVAFNEVYNNQYHGIIFSRDCINNSIHDNIVHDNAEHGIMLDRGSNNNIVENNTVYNNQDGLVIFGSSHNILRNNTTRDNQLSGVRINASYIAGDPFDDVATDNQILNNTITNNQQGIYLYARADRNLIANNTIISSTVNGIYIKSGGNTVQQNVIQKGGVGIAIVDGTDPTKPLPPQAKPPLDPPGHNNIVIGSTISNNSDTGIRILGGANNRIGAVPPTAANKNLIQDNQNDGVAIGNYATNGAVATDNAVLGNDILNNARHGISIKDVSSVHNRISQNSISGNKGYGIRIDAGAQSGIQPPIVSAIQADGHMSGKAKPNAVTEIYSDPAGEGKDFLGTTTANSTGDWAFDLPTGQNPKLVTVLQTDTSGNSSAFTGGASGALYTIGADINGQTTITVTGSGAVVTLTDIKTGLGISNTNAALLKCGNTALLQDLGNGLWQLNANLFIGPNVTLNLGQPSGSGELRLCSEPSVAASSTRQVKVIQSEDASDSSTVEVAPDYLSFIYLRTHSGVINMDHIKVHSWDPTTNNFDTNIDNGRAYVIAKYASTLNIISSELSYLGSADGESYGVSWRDVNDTTTPNLLRTRVSGEAIDSSFHHNYYGVYTFQAQDMVFRNNQFYNNVRYGFDPHDFTHDVLVENNVSYNNGAHGYIISRGCNNFTFRNNVAYNNNNPDPVDQAQGFMLDPGSPNAMFPQAPSNNNLLENNVAYGNEGFGLRILGSVNNQVLSNRFYQNGKGIVVDTNSTGNIIDSNVITKNVSYGLVTQDSADNNTLTQNTVSSNGDHGIYLHSNNNLISNNTATANTGAGIAFYSAALAIMNNQVLSNTVSGNSANGLDLRNTVKTLVQGNLVETNNGQAGIYLSAGASQNSISHNLIRNNQALGIRANGSTTLSNEWSENQIYGNLLGGIGLSSSGNLNMAAPQLISVVNNVVTGKANPNAMVELFSDSGRQGQFFEGRTTAGADGSFSFTLAASGQGANLTAVAIDVQGNASPFSAPISRGGQPLPTSTPLPTDTPDPNATPTNVPTATPTGTPVGTTQPNNIYLPTIRK